MNMASMPEEAETIPFSGRHRAAAIAAQPPVTGNARACADYLAARSFPARRSLSTNPL
jgi:hypothetical protein